MAGDWFSGIGDFFSGLGSTVGGWFGGGGGAAPAVDYGGASGAGSLAADALGPGGAATGPAIPGTGNLSAAGAPVNLYGGGGTPDFTAATGAGSGGGGGFMSTLSDVGNLAKSALPFASLATTGMGIASGISGMEQAAQQNKILKAEQQRQQQLAAPAAAAGASLTSAGQAAMLGGALPAQLESQVQELGDRLRAQYRQYLASIGQSDSTAAIQEDEWVSQQQNALREQLASQLLQSGYQGINTALGPSGAVSNTASNLTTSGAAGIGGANAALSKLMASQG